jgi:hypothetical protein
MLVVGYCYGIRSEPPEELDWSHKQRQTRAVAEYLTQTTGLSSRHYPVLSWAEHKQHIDLPCAKEKSAKSES